MFLLIINTLAYSNYWKHKKHRLLFFGKIAKNNNFDPLLPESWYSLSRSTISAFEVIIIINVKSNHFINY